MSNEFNNPHVEIAELSDEDRTRLAACQSNSASEDQVREYIKIMIDIRKKHYMAKCEYNAKNAAVVQDTVKEQLHTKNMQDLVGEIWAEIITRATKASADGKVPANYMLNAILHAATEASIMAIESYNNAYKAATGQGCNTAELVENYATSMGKAILECGRTRGLI